MTSTGTTGSSSRELPPAMQQTLDQIKALLEEGGSVEDVTAELTALLKALAQAFVIDQEGDETVDAGKSSVIGFVPEVEFPAVVTAKGSLPIVPTAAWEVLDANGRKLHNGKDFRAPDLGDLSLDVLLAPPVVELTKQPLPVRRFKIRVTLTLSMTLPGTLFTPAAEEPRKVSGSATLPDGVPLGLSARALGVPTLLALFRHKNFRGRMSGLDGFVVLVVDSSSPLGQLRDDKNGIKDRLDDMSFAAKAVTEALPGLPRAPLLRELARLADLIKDQPLRKVQEAARVDGHHEVRRLDRVVVSGALDAGNAISSLVLLNLGRDLVVECWNGAEFKKGTARFDLGVGPQGFVIVEDLSVERTKPVTIPADSQESLLRVRKKPGAFNSFNDGLSALRFRRT